MELSKYYLRKALRPFSFTVAVITCLAGLVSAATDGFVDNWLAFLVLFAALFLQAGVNLINDYADITLLSETPENRWAERLIRRNFMLGLGCILLAAVAGIYLVALRGFPLLMLLVLGLVGALGYTLEPVNFKRRGLAVVLVFWLMGVLMVCGAYYIVAGQLGWGIFWQSLPVSLLSSLLLLSNEIRDLEADAASGIRTLSVRIGFKRACSLYRLLLFNVGLLSALLWLTGYLDSAGWLLISLPLALLLPAKLVRNIAARKRLPPLTGRFFMLFGLLYTLSLSGFSVIL
ncbi:MAG: prenyltransferase [Amphritea sp.]